MGRKKGKQGGISGYKSKSAAFKTEINNYVSEYYQSSSRPRQRQNGNGNVNGNTSSSSSSAISMRSSSASVGNNEPRKALVGLTQLRGILRERMMEDRQRDANHRRLFTTTSRTRQRHSITNTNTLAAQRQKQQTTATLSCNKEIPPVGWLMHYDHRERMAGILPARKSHNNAAAVPSLHSLCINALAPVLNAYVEALGKTYIHERLGLLPADTISDISIRCQDINDSVAYVVGAHSHLDRCVWNGKPSVVLVSEGEGDGDEGGLDDGLLTTNGLIEALVFSERSMAMTTTTTPEYECVNELWNDPTDIATDPDTDTDTVTDTDTNEKKVILESWEDAADSDERMMTSMMCSRRNRNLKRLEIRNFHPPTAEDAIEVLTKCCPSLTHLSLSNSLNAQTGPAVLLWDWDAHSRCFNADADVDAETRPGSTSTLVDLFQNLEVLDLSGCQWLDVDVFNSFITRLVNKKIRYIYATSDGDDDANESDDDDNMSENENDFARRGDTTLQLIYVGGCNQYLSQKCDFFNNYLTSKKPLISISPPPI